MILAIIQITMLVFALLVGWRLAATLKRTSMTDDERAQAFGGQFFGLVASLIGGLFIAALSTPYAWGFVAAPLAIYLPSLKHLLGANGKFIRPRFSSRRMFFFITLFTVLIAVLSGIWRWHQSSLADIEQRRVAAHRAIEIEAYQRNRARIESRRNKLSPDYYERTTKELDAEASRLGVE